jgi:Tfp pilus assembly protein FimV
MTVKMIVRLLVPAFAAAMVPALFAEESTSRGDIDRALRTLLADYDINQHLELRHAEEIATGFYEVRPGDTLDGIINRAIAGTTIRKEILRDAFIAANPRAFPSRSPHRMLAGVKLRIPTADDVMRLVFTVDPAELELDRRVRASWVHFP